MKEMIKSFIQKRESNYQKLKRSEGKGTKWKFTFIFIFSTSTASWGRAWPPAPRSPQGGRRGNTPAEPLLPWGSSPAPRSRGRSSTWSGYSERWQWWRGPFSSTAPVCYSDIAWWCWWCWWRCWWGPSCCSSSLPASVEFRRKLERFLDVDISFIKTWTYKYLDIKYHSLVDD